MPHLRSVDIQPDPQEDEFPFSLPVVRSWERLELTNPVTFLVGENGSGKSTVLEALAAAAGMVTVGAAAVHSDQALHEVRRLADRMRLVWNKRTQRGFFLRAEDFIGFIRQQVRTRADLKEELDRVDTTYEGRTDFAKGLAKMPAAGQLKAMEERYGSGLENRSHGEQFLDFFQARFVPGGLYLLDEPEAPLSPMRQLGLLALIREMLAQNAQFLIATHSPILMAFPGAQILSFDEHPPKVVSYEDLEHVKITRDFLNNPETFLRFL